MINNRRDFLKVSVAATTWMAARPGFAAPAIATPYEPLALGVKLGLGDDPDATMATLQSLGVHTCQLNADQLDGAMIGRLTEAIDKYKIAVTAIGTDVPGPQVYNFYDGPITLGLIPRTYRAQRAEKMKGFSDAVKQVGIPAIRMHAGFIPENPNDELYREAIEVLRDVIGHCRRNGQQFLYETGTETPVTLVRAIEDVGLDNQGVNLDTANLILYDKANPVDALDILGPYVKNTHAKDGLYPTNTHDLGREVEIPHGKVDFPKLIAKLRNLRYRGPLIIEREIHGAEQLASVKRELSYLRTCLNA